MSLFTEYEKLKTVRKSLTIGSKWEIVESTEGYYGCNTLGGIVTLVELNSTDVGYTYTYSSYIREPLTHLVELNSTDVGYTYTYSSYIREPLTHFRNIETFKRTFRPVL
jgi:hypothetical protein